jgi:hypothetical protein
VSVSPADGAQLARSVSAIYAQAELRLLGVIATHLRSGKDAPDWLVRRLGDVRAVRGELEAVMRGVEHRTPGEVERAIAGASRLGARTAARDLAAAGLAHAAHPGLASVTFLARVSTERLFATHLRVLRTTLDVYRAAVSAEGAVLMAGSGATRLSAAQHVLDRFASAGIRGFVDSAGRSWELASYAEMAMRTTTGQAAVESALRTYQENGEDLVVVSDSPQECELCAPWEGVVLSINGRTPGYPTVDEATAAGLLHANCTHDLGLYVEGLTRADSARENPEGYAERQEQRHLERGVREWKRREAVALTEAAQQKAAAKVGEWQGRLREFTEETGRRRLYYREQIGKAH